jgi:hypothetical protein
MILSTQVFYRGATISSIEHFLYIKYAYETFSPRRFSPLFPFFPPPGTKLGAYDLHLDPANPLTFSHDLETPVIYVALNYRLTIFGFARTPLLKDEQSFNVG